LHGAAPVSEVIVVVTPLLSNVESRLGNDDNPLWPVVLHYSLLTPINTALFYDSLCTFALLLSFSRSKRPRKYLKDVIASSLIFLPFSNNFFTIFLFHHVAVLAGRSISAG